MPLPDCLLTDIRTDARLFQRDLTRLGRKHPDLAAAVERACAELRLGIQHWGDPIPQFSHRVWKRRLGAGGHGTRALRLIFEVDRATGTAWLLRLFAKNEIADLTVSEIERARMSILGR